MYRAIVQSRATTRRFNVGTAENVRVLCIHRTPSLLSTVLTRRIDGHTIVRCKKAVEETNGDGGFGNDNGGFGNGGFGANGSAPTNGTTGFETNAMDVNDGGDNKSGFGGNPEFDGGW